VLSRSGREHLLAQAADGALLVHRCWGPRRRVLVLNFGPEPLSLAAIAPRLQLSAPVTLLRSSEFFGSTLPAGSSVVLRGEEGPTAKVETDA
jgi:hypothetical protein